MTPRRNTWVTKYSLWIIGGLLSLLIGGFTVGQKLANDYHTNIIKEANGLYFFKADGDAVGKAIVRLSEQNVTIKEQLLDFCKSVKDMTNIINQIDKRLAIIEVELRKLNDGR